MKIADILTIALPKGKLFKPAMSIFNKLGVDLEIDEDSRKLVIEDIKNGFKFMIVRAVDIPTYVEYGAADIGIVGSDLLMEQEKDIYEPVDLGFGGCRLVVAEPRQTMVKDNERNLSKIRVATKYPKITEKYFSNRGIACEIIKLYGSIELAPIVGLAEKIVDLTSTGKTLEENNLVEVETIAESSARLVVNRASHKIKYKEILNFVNEVRKIIEGR